MRAEEEFSEEQKERWLKVMEDIRDLYKEKVEEYKRKNSKGMLEGNSYYVKKLPEDPQSRVVYRLKQKRCAEIGTAGPYVVMWYLTYGYIFVGVNGVMRYNLERPTLSGSVRSYQRIEGTLRDMRNMKEQLSRPMTPPSVYNGERGVMEDEDPNEVLKEESLLLFGDEE